MRDKDTRRNLQPSRAVPLISTFIVVVLGIQGVISLLAPLRSGSIKATWPFVNYPMYRLVHREGEIIPNRVILGVREDGTEVELKAEDLGWSHWFYGILSAAVMNQNRELVKSLLQRGIRTRNTQWRLLKVVDRGMVFRLSGLSPAPETELAVMRLHADQEPRP